MTFKSVFFTFNFCSHFEGVNIVSIFASSMLRLAHEFALLLGLSDLPDMKSPKFLTATKTWGLFHFREIDIQQLYRETFWLLSYNPLQGCIKRGTETCRECDRGKSSLDLHHEA